MLMLRVENIKSYCSLICLLWLN